MALRANERTEREPAPDTTGGGPPAPQAGPAAPAPPTRAPTTPSGGLAIDPEDPRLLLRHLASRGGEEG